MRRTNVDVFIYPQITLHAAPELHADIVANVTRKNPVKCSFEQQAILFSGPSSSE